MGTERTQSSELESFRKEWQEEVRRGRSKSSQQEPSSSSTGDPQVSRPAEKNLQILKPPASSSTQYDEDDDSLAHTYHDLESKDDALRLGSSSDVREKPLWPSEPKTALDHYERAVERETAGKLGDSVSLYRQAFRVCSYSPMKCYDVHRGANIRQARRRSPRSI